MVLLIAVQQSDDVFVFQPVQHPEDLHLHRGSLVSWPRLLNDNVRLMIGFCSHDASIDVAECSGCKQAHVLQMKTRLETPLQIS